MYSAFAIMLLLSYCEGFYCFLLCGIETVALWKTLSASNPERMHYLL